jgi:AmiR/NasT family two-component response regulator
VKRRRETNRGLEEESRRLREEGAHKHLRREALTRRDRSREKDVLVEQLNKGQPSD